MRPQESKNIYIKNKYITIHINKRPRHQNDPTGNRRKTKTILTAGGTPGTGACADGAATAAPIGAVGAGTSPGRRIGSGAGATSRVLPRARPLALPTPSAISKNEPRLMLKGT